MLGIVTWSHLRRFTQPRVIAGSAGLVRLATRCLNGSTTTVKRTMGLLKERGLVESVQGIAGNKNHGRDSLSLPAGTEPTTYRSRVHQPTAVRSGFDGGCEVVAVVIGPVLRYVLSLVALDPVGTPGG